MTAAHVDTFARDNLPAPELQPDFLFNLPELQFGAQINCATELLDRHISEERGDRVCIRGKDGCWTYRDLNDRANQIANVLTREMGLVSGNRVLLHSSNTPMMAACWFGVVKISHALYEASLCAEMRQAGLAAPQLHHFNYSDPDSLEAAIKRQSNVFENVNTAVDTCLIAFTSVTTGIPKATMHFHRDVMAICACWPSYVLKPNPDNIFIGSPPLAFTFGLGGMLLFPMSVGASTVLLDKAGPTQLLYGIKEFGATVMFNAPTSYRTLSARGSKVCRTSWRSRGRCHSENPSGLRQERRRALQVPPRH